MVDAVQRARRRAVLAELTALSQDTGLYDEPVPYCTEHGSTLCRKCKSRRRRARERAQAQAKARGESRMQ